MGFFSQLRLRIGEAIHKLIPYKQIEQAGGFESPVSHDMTAALTLWAQMYLGKAPWLSEEGMKNLNIAALVCSELARQVTMEMKWNITGTEKNADGEASMNPRAEYLKEQFIRCTGTTLREKLEQGMAAGGMVVKPYLSGGNIYFDFVPDWSVYPVSFDGDKHMTDVIFRDIFQDGRTTYTRLERHKLESKKIEGTDKTEVFVIITQRCFRSESPDILGRECSLSEVPAWAELNPELIVNETGGRMLFGWYRVAAANTVDLDAVIGASVFAKAVGCIRDADAQYSRLMWEYEAKETAIDVDPSVLIPKSARDTGGRRYEMPKLNSRLFRAVDLGTEQTYNVFDPPIRDISLLNGLNQILCRVEDLCGIARGTLSDPNAQAMTATQIMMLRQRTYETISSNQAALEQCLRDVIHAMDIYASLNHAPKGEINASFEWDDSVITDTNQQLNERIALKNAGAMSAAELRMWYLGETPAQAEAAVQKIEAERMQSMLLADSLPQ